MFKGGRPKASVWEHFNKVSVDDKQKLEIDWEMKKPLNLCFVTECFEGNENLIINCMLTLLYFNCSVTFSM